MERVADAFLAVADRQPDETALVHRGRRIGYGHLKQRVLELAAALDALEPRAPVALHATKTPGTVTAMLAALVAGIPYVPVDPAIPAARRSHQLRDSGARVLLVDDEDGPPARPPAVDPDCPVTVTPLSELTVPAGGSTGGDFSNIANILYTSGSTGLPKGVLTTHENATTFLRWAQELIDVGPRETVACYAPLHFDMHVFDVFGTLSQGATVLLLDDRTILFPEAVCRTLREERATLMYAVPSAWIGLLRSAGLTDGGLPELRTLMYSGEEFPVPRLRELAALLPRPRIVNIYGPVETNAVTALEVTSEHLALDRIPIGLPFGASKVFLVDAEGRPVVRPGAEGEIVVHTATLCEGYLGDPERTAATRLAVQTDEGTYETYRTGDFGCWGEDGLLHFRGRRDGRIKTRGFRVEIGEVEARIRAHPDVEDVVVATRPHPERTHELVAFVTLSPGCGRTGAEVTAWCREFLAPYMVPRELRLLADMPRTGTGKADRVALARAARTEENR
ncbi:MULTISPECIES: amino acid adenylation domain-containing protein [unclassified Streptomyces]|uniref:amino acid adenylation domain-containing protein n=1 Tax=unclassified Streptomyces TaxID=2593676 RepID=UPI00190D7F02|nr:MULTISPECIES: amino acid adenylation domain-containing protein [unclassified Streptomyces]MBK3569776.1 amino acid adenylation domain-containing protein [Streptomyces sp. MBT62]MBK6015414.1 amino acid adenylation domain-containing protein [Streptomyces sp. MBT53]